jgi:hypothetical protein
MMPRCMQPRISPKALALVLMAALSFASPLVETLARGRVEPLSAFGFAELFASILLLFWWYHLDKAEHGYERAYVMNAGVLLMAVIALPIYFVRTRGWRRGVRAIALAGAFVLFTFLLGEAGEWLGSRLGA